MLNRVVAGLSLLYYDTIISVDSDIVINLLVYTNINLIF